MNGMPFTFNTLFPSGPIAGRAQRLSLADSECSFSAWLARADSSDLADLMPENYLHRSELAQAATFRFAARRQTFLLGRLAAKAVLGAYLVEADWGRIEIAHGVFGQPLVNYPDEHGVEVSLSHSSGLAVAVAFPRECPMAIDMETVDRGRAATVKSELQFLPAEEQWIQSAAVEEQAAYVLLWTVREALGKVLRCGLTCPLELLGVDEIKSLADGVWQSDYHNFQQFKCLSWIQSDRVLSIALPRAMTLQPGIRDPER